MRTRQAREDIGRGAPPGMAYGLRMLRSRFVARLRGDQTKQRLLDLGLRSTGKFTIARGVYVDANFAWAVTIGDGVVIAHDVKITAHDAALKRLMGYTVVRPIEIGARAYIGAGSILLPGARIGEGSIVGAGSIVTGEIPPHCVAYGNPCRVQGATEDLQARHEQAMREVEVFERAPRNMPLAQRRQMREALERDGTIYVR